jgi:adenylate cyclase
MKVYKFRDWYLNPVERRVLKDGNYLDLTPKTFDVLLLLIENHGEIVTKDEILGQVWNGSFVEEGNLAVHISKLRRSLDEDKNQSYIETVQGSGYRFVAPVQEAGQGEWEHLSSGLNPSSQKKKPSEWTFDSIAVLPLQNESNDEEIEYLTDGLTESFINSLSRFPNLRVIARNTVFRYKDKPVDAKQVGETLGVSTVLTGRIRLIKDRLIIGIELTKTADGTQLWGTHFNRAFTDIFEIQESIILEVLENLKSEISNASKKHAANLITNNFESYRLYLKGKYLLEKWTEDNIYKAIKNFEQSISYDPLNVNSYVEMIECYFALYFSDYISYESALTKINPLLSVVSEMNQSIDVVQAMYGAKTMYLDWKFKESGKHFENSLRINPNCLIARNRYALLLLITGKFSEALQVLQPIILVDPFSLLSYKRASRLFYRIGRFENANVYLRGVLELEPTDYEALAILGASLAELGEYNEALINLQKSLSIQFNVETLGMIGYVNAREGNKDKAYNIINQIESKLNGDVQHSIKLARIYAALGENEVALKFLEKAFHEHDVDLLGLKSDPRWATMINEPRFKDLVIKVGLPID